MKEEEVKVPKQFQKTTAISMYETINQLRTILAAERFMLTGSFALSLMGLVDKNKVEDLDIILTNPAEGTYQILESLMKDNPAQTKPYKDRKDLFIFMYNGVKVDVFISNKPEESDLKFNGIYIAKVDHIVAAKRQNNRVKDWAQLRNIARRIFKQERFETFLNNY